MKHFLLSSLAVLALATVSTTHAALLDSPQKGGLKLKSITSLGFGKDGLLLVADTASASVVAIETKDTGPFAKLSAPVQDITSLIAGGLGTTAENITLVDMAVNPASGRVYLAVQRKPDNAALILTVDAAGKVGEPPNRPTSPPSGTFSLRTSAKLSPRAHRSSPTTDV